MIEYDSQYLSVIFIELILNRPLAINLQEIISIRNKAEALSSNETKESAELFETGSDES